MNLRYEILDTDNEEYYNKPMMLHTVTRAIAIEFLDEDDCGWEFDTVRRHNLAQIEDMSDNDRRTVELKCHDAWHEPVTRIVVCNSI